MDWLPGLRLDLPHHHGIDWLSDSWLKLALTPRPALLASPEGCGTWPLVHEDAGLAVTLSPLALCLFGSSWCLLHPDIILVDHPASLPCFYITKGRKRTATCILLGPGSCSRKKFRYTFKLELSFVHCLEHVLPPTSYWRWQYSLPQCKAAAEDIQGVIWNDSRSTSVSLENHRSCLARIEARGIRLQQEEVITTGGLRPRERKAETWEGKHC